MEPTVTISLSRYEQMKTEVEHLRKVKESRMSLHVVKHYPNTNPNTNQYYGSRIIDEAWNYFIDIDSLPDVSKELAEKLEEYRKEYENVKEWILIYQKEYSDAIRKIKSLEETLKDNTKKKKWFWF